MEWCFSGEEGKDNATEVAANEQQEEETPGLPEKMQAKEGDMQVRPEDQASKVKQGPIKQETCTVTFVTVWITGHI